MRDYVIIVTITPITNGNGEPDTTLERTFTIAAHPLTVSFPRLVSALTCSNFSINDETAFRTQVAKTVLTAALGDGDPCSVISNTNGGTGNDIPNLAGYNWQIPETSNLILRAAKGEKVDDTTELFRIEFPPDKDGKSYLRVWVEDADNYEGKSSQEVCNDVKEWIPDAQNYNSYLLNLNVKGEPCLSGHGAKAELIVKKYTLAHALGYAATCYATTIGCEVITNVATGGFKSALFAKSSIGELIGCAVAPAIMYFQRESLFAEHPAATWAGSALLGAAIGSTSRTAYLSLKYGYPTVLSRFIHPPAAPKITDYVVETLEWSDEAKTKAQLEIKNMVECAKGGTCIGFTSKEEALQALEDLYGGQVNPNKRDDTIKDDLVRKWLRKQSYGSVIKRTLTEEGVDKTLDYLKSARDRYAKFDDLAKKAGIDTRSRTVIENVFAQLEIDDEAKAVIMAYLEGGDVPDDELRKTIESLDPEDVENLFGKLADVDKELGETLKSLRLGMKAALCGALGQVAATLVTYASMGFEVQPTINVNIQHVAPATSISVNPESIEVS